MQHSEIKTQMERRQQSKEIKEILLTHAFRYGTKTEEVILSRIEPTNPLQWNCAVNHYSYACMVSTLSRVVWINCVWLPILLVISRTSKNIVFNIPVSV